MGSYALGDFIRRQQQAASAAAPQNVGPDLDQIGRLRPSLFNNFRAGMMGAPAYGQDVELAIQPSPSVAPPPAQSLMPDPLPIERAINRPSPVNMESLQAGAFQGRPGFNSSVGGAAPTASQLAQDTNARALIEAKYAIEDEATGAEAARRGNPMADQIAGLGAERQYESLLPYGSTSRIGASFGSGWGDLSGSEVGSDVVGEQPIGAPTIGEAKAQQQGEIQSLIRNAPQMRELEMRYQAVQQLQKLRAMAEAAVAAGKDPKAVEENYQRQERLILQGLTAISGKDLGFFGAGI